MDADVAPPATAAACQGHTRRRKSPSKKSRALTEHESDVARGIHRGGVMYVGEKQFQEMAALSAKEVLWRQRREAEKAAAMQQRVRHHLRTNEVSRRKHLRRLSELRKIGALTDQAFKRQQREEGREEARAALELSIKSIAADDAGTYRAKSQRCVLALGEQRQTLRALHELAVIDQRDVRLRGEIEEEQRIGLHIIAEEFDRALRDVVHSEHTVRGSSHRRKPTFLVKAQRDQLLQEEAAERRIMEQKFAVSSETLAVRWSVLQNTNKQATTPVPALAGQYFTSPTHRRRSPLSPCMSPAARAMLPPPAMISTPTWLLRSPPRSAHHHQVSPGMGGGGSPRPAADA